MDSVGVVILTKDNFDVIKRCLDSFEDKNSYDNVKFYIGDTGSTEENYNKLSNYIKEFKYTCLLYTSPSPRDATLSRMPSSA